MKNYLQLWTIKRLIQLLVGFYFIWEYFFKQPSYFALFFGGLMTIQAVLNIGCFSSKGCAVPNNHSSSDFSENDEVTFEEVE